MAWPRVTHTDTRTPTHTRLMKTHKHLVTKKDQGNTHEHTFSKNRTRSRMYEILKGKNVRDKKLYLKKKFNFY